MYKHVLSTLLSILITLGVYAQNIEGILIDATNNTPIDGGFITLLTSTKKYITSSYTEKDGKFSIHQSSNDSVFLSINTIGYKDTLILIPSLQQEHIFLGKIFLQLNEAIALEEVTITAKPYTLRKSTDRIVMAMTNKSELIKNNTIWGMLRYTPMLKVDEVQGLSMLGKQDLVVYINGRKTTMSGSDVQNYLKSMPAENIKNIELITSPGSTFNVSAQTGVINIVLKRNEYEGLKGFASLQLWQTHYNKQIGSLNLNYLKGKFDVKTTFSARNVADWNKSENYIYFPKTDLITERNSMYDNRRQLYQGNIDLAFRPNKNQTLGLIFDFSIWDGKPTTRSVSRYAHKMQQESPDSVLISKTESDTRTNRFAVNLNYTIQFNEKNKLAIDADYQRYTMNQKENYLSFSENTPLNKPASYLQKIPQNNDLWMGQVEYTTQLNEKHKLIIGSNAYLSTSLNENKFTELQNLPAQFYVGNRFDYDEKGVAGYFSYEAQWSNKFSMALGSRIEYTNTQGELKYPEVQTLSHNYCKWLPSLSLTYLPTESQYFWYSLSSQNSFPVYEDLNPFKNYQTATSYTTGNPDLKPSLTYYQELGYYSGQIMLILAHYFTKDDIEGTYRRPEDNTNIEITSPINYGNKSGLRLSVNMNRSFFNNIWFLNTSLMGEYSHYKSDYPGLNISKDKFYGEINIDNTIVLSKKRSWKLLCNYQFRTVDKRLLNKSESDMRGSIEIRKNIKDWAFAISGYRSWNYNGHKYSSVRKSTYTTPELEQRRLSIGEYQGGMFKVSYNFGNKKVRSGKKHEMINSNQKERYGGNR